MSEFMKRPRSRMGARLSASLAEGRFELPCCATCGAVQYPPADLCRQCLGNAVEMSSCDPRATVIASAAVHRSYAADFEDGGSWAIASVKMDAGPIVFAHVTELLDGGTTVTLVALTDRVGDGVLGAVRTDSEVEQLKQRFRQR